mmetsp:Transcript_2064/g.6009  ORF Transcript_2064/g.6009 Transcript_2064/m.6009 type:complete len:374 (-) Transcript_2064:46-1167(-)
MTAFAGSAVSANRSTSSAPDTFCNLETIARWYSPIPSLNFLSYLACCRRSSVPSGCAAARRSKGTKFLFSSSLVWIAAFLALHFASSASSSPVDDTDEKLSLLIDLLTAEPLSSMLSEGSAAVGGNSEVLSARSMVLVDCAAMVLEDAVLEAWEAWDLRAAIRPAFAAASRCFCNTWALRSITSCSDSATDDTSLSSSTSGTTGARASCALRCLAEYPMMAVRPQRWTSEETGTSTTPPATWSWLRRLPGAPSKPEMLRLLPLEATLPCLTGRILLAGAWALGSNARPTSSCGPPAPDPSAADAGGDISGASGGGRRTSRVPERGGSFDSSRSPQQKVSFQKASAQRTTVASRRSPNMGSGPAHTYDLRDTGR